MTAEVAKARSSLHKALDRLGHANTHQCPASSSNYDRVLHELFVAHEGYAYFDKRKKNAAEAIVDVADKGAIDIAPGTEQAVLEGNLYSLVVKVNNPASRIVRGTIAAALMKRGWAKTNDEVNEFINDISRASKPATSIKAVPRL